MTAELNQPTSKPNLTARELEEADIPHLVRYWCQAEEAFMLSLGVDVTKLPSAESLTGMLKKQLTLPYSEKPAYCLIWEVDGRAVGHCNTNPIHYGKEAFMHLHLWEALARKGGLGTEFVHLSLPFFYRNLNLETLFCEPYALNPAPNKTLSKLGFRLVKEYTTTPGSLNFEQPVKRWALSATQFADLQKTRPKA